jgi:hypothetical protein
LIRDSKISKEGRYQYPQIDHEFKNQARLTTEPILEQIQHRQGTEASSSTEAATNTRGHQYQQTDQHTHNPTRNSTGDNTKRSITGQATSTERNFPETTTTKVSVFTSKMCKGKVRIREGQARLHCVTTTPPPLSMNLSSKLFKLISTILSD